MNIILGVDKGENCMEPSAAETLLRRLRFPNAEIEVAHVLTPWPYGALLFDGVLTSEALALEERMIRGQASSLVDHVAGRLLENLPDFAAPESVSHRVLKAASATEGLLETAKEINADLIVVDGPHSSPLGAFLTGSVARSLVAGSHPHSLLLAKSGKPNAKSDEVASENTGARTTTGRLRVVFATDHSPYANRCVEELLRLAPQGIEHLTVMTAFSRHDLRNAQDWLPDLRIDLVSAVHDTLEKRNQDVLQKLGPLLYPNNASHDLRVVDAPVQEAIAQTMEETKADLLIVGARGHGFVDRVTFGSVSFDHAMNAPYSLLVLRAQEQTAESNN